MNNQNSNGAEQDAVGLATQLAHTILIALRTIHEYVVPRAESRGIRLSAKEKHSWAMNLSIALSQNKAHLKLPTTRVEKAPTQKRVQKATPLFAEPKQESEVLRQVRELMKAANVSEAEVLEILRENGAAMFASDLSAVPEWTLRLVIERWEVLRELAEVGRTSA